MTWFWLAATVLPAVLWSVVLVHTVLSVWRVPRLEDVPMEELPRWPRLSLITPACDEEPVIESALRSALASDYPELEVVAVNDRSRDRTGEIIDGLAAEDRRLAAVHVDTLPDGWLGKLNALSRGVGRATGEWLLFADSDTHYAAGSLRRAVLFAERARADLVTAYPHVTSRALLSDAVFAVAPVVGQASMPFWKVADPGSKVFAGLGAFILVRRSAYERGPGLEWLRLEVADDMGLGLLIKAHGGRVALVNGRNQVLIEFYASFGEMLRRMQKNWWAIMARFSVLRACGLGAVMTWLAVTPFLALFPGLPVAARVAAGLGWGALTTASVVLNRWVRRPLLPALLPSLGLLLCVVMLARSTWVGARIGGIEWRGRVYRSEVLRDAQRVRV